MARRFTSNDAAYTVYTLDGVPPSEYQRGVTAPAGRKLRPSSRHIGTADDSSKSRANTAGALGKQNLLITPKLSGAQREFAPLALNSARDRSSVRLAEAPDAGPFVGPEWEVALSLKGGYGHSLWLNATPEAQSLKS